MRSLISVKDIYKTYSMGETKVHALQGVTVEINSGDFISVMGASGSGKSTFMNILGCLDAATSGTYELDGQDVLKLNGDQLAEVRNIKIGFIFQSFNILPRTSAVENVELPLLYNSRIKNKIRREMAMQALAAVGLQERANSYPNQLSGGQQQRVAIARALVNNPLVILADEPTGNLDSKTSYEIMDIFQRLNDQGRTIIMVTHEEDIAKFSRFKIIFRDGKIISAESIDKREYASEMLKKIQAEEKVGA